MSAMERLQAVQSALQQRGVHDVKFCFAKGVSDYSADDVMAKVADFMEAYAVSKRACATPSTRAIVRGPINTGLAGKSKKGRPLCGIGARKISALPLSGIRT